MWLRTAVVVFLSAATITGCAYYAPPPEPVYSYVPCPPAAVPPPPATAPGGAGGNQCLTATAPYPPYQYYVAPSYYPYASPYYPGYPGAGVSFGFGVIR
jgi:hypothetical protein